MADTKTKKTARKAKKAASGSVKDSAVGKTSKEILDKGLEASKKWFESARKTIAEWGDESVKQVEIAKLNAKLEKGYKALGKLVFSKLSGKKGSVSLSTDDEEIGEAIKLLSDMAKKIKKLGGNPASAGGKAAKQKKDTADGGPKLLPAPKTRSKKIGGAEEKAPSRTRKSSGGKTAGRSTAKSGAGKGAAKTAAAKKTSGGAKKSSRTGRAKKAETETEG